MTHTPNAILDCMDTALIVVGFILVGILVIWTFAHLSDPEEIGEEEEAQVRHETPQEREHELFEEEAKKAESNADDIAFYSPGDSNAD